MTRSKRSRGYMLGEVVAVTAIVGTMAGMVIVDLGKVLSHARSLSTLSGVSQVLAAARLQAVKRGVQVVVQVSIEPPPSKRVCLRTFEDKDGDFTLTTTGTPETILSDYVVDSAYHLWKKDGTKDDLDGAALFNTYAGNAALKQRIAFLPDGGIAIPQAPDSAAPAGSGGRGIYLADAAGKTWYRITIPTPLLARPRVDQWTAGAYAPTGWSF